MNSAFFVGNKKLLHSQRHRVEDVRLIHYTSLRAEDLASKAALIILLTACQANTFQNKHVSKNGWNIWSHCAENKVEKQLVNVRTATYE